MGKPQKAANLGEDLHTAARSGDLNAVQLICSTNPLAINSRDKHSRTPYPSSSSSRLHLAAWSGQAQVVSCLCKNKADVGAAAMDDMGAIHFAAQKGHLEVVRILVSSGVSVKACNRKGMTALHYAVQGSHLELIKYLLKKGASLSAKTKAGKTPLGIATSEDVRSILVGYERESKKVELDVKGNAEEAGQKSSPEERAEVSGGEAATSGHEAGNENDGSVKRKGDENADRVDLPEKKKAKVVLSHLDMDDQPDE